ncbi:AI-2E family transporter [Sphingomonas sp. AP4-R1]|uniref:AI-2E family transporter n=1 Tax=Sphingomonas sp. AP4-R1 TaxID=2735134 RepID=UPI001493AA1D|nr:AI-2E family transporter [Sphingomonas sp. AP4-R1]QJU57789.1 AI-2E family transporter [Sphingomonas sp. AP4-R1]
MIRASDPARLHRIAKVVLTIALVAFGLWIGGTFLPALVWAGIIAIAIDPLYRRAEMRWPWARDLALPLIGTTLIALLVLVPLAMGAVEAAREAKYLFAWLADAQENGLPEPQWLARVPLFSDQVTAWWHDNLATPEAAGEQFHRLRSKVLIEQSQLLGKGLILRSVIFGFTLMSLFFVLRDRDKIVAQFSRAGERLLGPAGRRLGGQVILSVRGTIDGLVLVGIGEGVAMVVVYVACGVPHPLLFGAVTAVAAMIPFGAAAIFLVTGALLVGQGAVGTAIILFAIGMGVVFVADHFIRPVLIGGATKLPFLFVLIGILGGVEMLGLLGLFVGPATMAVLIMLWRDYVGAGARGE